MCKNVTSSHVTLGSHSPSYLSQFSQLHHILDHNILRYRITQRFRMRFASIAIAFTLATKSDCFVPQAANSAIHGMSNSGYGPVIYEAADVPSTSSRSTSLSLFNLAARAARKLNAPAKLEGEGAPTEKEVRALFELWNSALATGDSRIVASRYTKVSSFRSVGRVSRWLSSIPSHRFGPFRHGRSPRSSSQLSRTLPARTSTPSIATLSIS